MEAKVPLLEPEMIEVILSYCDGSSLLNMEATTSGFAKLIKSLEKRKSIWKNCCTSEMSKEEISDIRNKWWSKCRLEMDIPITFWKDIYGLWHKWNFLKNWSFKVIKCDRVFTSIECLKTSGSSIFIGHRTGLSVMKVKRKYIKEFGAYQVSSITLERSDEPIPSKEVDNNKFYEYDKVNLILNNWDIESFNVNSKKHSHLKFNHSVFLQFLTDGQFSSHSIFRQIPTAFSDISTNDKRTFAITRESILSICPDLDLKWEIVFDSKLVKYLLVYHTRLVILVKPDHLTISLDGNTKTFFFNNTYTQPITVAFFYSNVLFLGSAYGAIYMYKLNRIQDLMSLDLSNYTNKVHIKCHSSVLPISTIDVIENGFNKNPTIVATTHQHVYIIEAADNII